MTNHWRVCDLFQVRLWVWQEVKDEAMPVNEVVYTCAIERTVGPDGMRQWCELAWMQGGVSSCVSGVAKRLVCVPWQSG